MPSSSSPLPVSRPYDAGFGVYVHWPFCEAKCPYCDFNSHVRHGGVDEDRFRAAYLNELDHMRALTGPREVQSVFFGGGTPSRMAPKTAHAILERIARNWGFAAGAETTIEANPTSVEAGRFAGFRAAGINRVSLGLQALDDAALKRLGRTHDVDTGLAALSIARATFDRVSFDLIYARPNQSIAAWRQELTRALALADGHLSLYQLTIEDGTPFAALHKTGRLVCPDDEAARALYEVTQELCDGAGLPAYEVSNHAAPGAECRHNLIYWRGGDYAGVGPGAHGRLTVDGTRRAMSTLYAPEAWADRAVELGHGLERDDGLAPQDVAAEYLLMAMRLSEGVDLQRHRALGGEIDDAALAGLRAGGLVQVAGERIAATREGRLVLNAVIAALAMQNETIQ